MVPTSYLKDDYVFQSGDEFSGIYYVMEGSLGIVKTFKVHGIDFDVSLAEIASNSFLGVEKLFEGVQIDYSVKSLEETTLNENPLSSQKELKNLMNEQPEYGVQVLRSLLKSVAQTADFILQLNKLCVNIAKLSLIGEGVLGYLNTQYKINIENSDLLGDSLKVYNFFQENNINLFPLTKDVFSAPFENYMEEDDWLMNQLDKKEVYFFTKLYSLPAAIQSQFFSKDPFFSFYFTEKASIHFSNLLKLAEDCFYKVIDEYSRINKCMDALIKSKPALAKNQDLVRYIKLVVNTLLNNVVKISTPVFKRKSPALNEEFKRSVESYKTRNAVEVTEESSFEEEESYSIPEELKNATEQIINFAELEEEEYQSFMANYNKFKMLEDKLSGDDSVKRLRGRVTEGYWNIYEKCYLRYYQSTELPKPVEMMFRYGFFDEELVRPKTISVLFNLQQRASSDEDDLPVYDLFEWLQKISEREREPSMSAMGETYKKHLQEEAKRRSRKTIISPEEIDSVEARLQFEIKNMAKECAKVCSGEIFNYSPILLEEAFPGDSDKYFTKKEKIKEVFMKIREIDFSAFYREVRFRDKDRGIEEFIQTEILPNIILLPTWGKRPMVWQVKEKPKESRGRIILPHFVLEKLDNILIGVFGYYRWEIVKEILGPLWNDITQMSLTAEYTDYVQTFKKNKDLSMEMREKIKIEFKKFRSDRDRFVNDYLKWLNFESKGRPMTNKVVRSIFYRHVPFQKEVRDHIKDMPAYEAIHTRFTNLRRKDIRKLRNKYQKYTKDGKPLPQELQSYIDFFSR